jgi:hypothetical protein
MEKISIGNFKLRYLFLLLGSLAFVITGAFLTFKKSDTMSFTSGWSAIIFFGACAIIFLLQIIDSRPRLIIDENGIFDRTLSIGLISWSDIADAYVGSIKGQHFICLKLKDENKYLAKLSNIAKVISSANIALGFERININLSGLNVKPEQVCELIVKKAALAEMQ